ncbi:hypothetical protein Nepgr_007250 [Nepenthes gracilis]|uniref:Uncharacterized protein n=1 Tax=Nepenthes gracilis TaxID=150966 RepID=A0AAD3S6L7_NEPGR|nr:hypothetical protein Nepgr_007250 [Nepenthes gracilis]
MSMKTFKSWRWLPRKRSALTDTGAQGTHGFRVRQLPFMAVVCTVMLFIVYRTTKYQYRHTEIETQLQPFDGIKESTPGMLNSLPHGIIHSRSDLELRSVWLNTRSKVNIPSHHNLLAMAVGIKQKHNVNTIVHKFLTENFTIVLFHYDGNMEGWSDLEWSNKAIHIMAQNQTKWWFAKRFLHPDIVSMYDFVFLWDEDLGVENFHPGRYLDIVKSEGLEISQPAIDPNSAEIHHKITIRKRTKKFHRRVYDGRGSLRCSSASHGPPCTGWVEGMAPVFSRAAWCCTWHLIQNDLVHGWGLDMKFGYCAQGDRTEKVGVVDSEYIIHQGIQTLGGSSVKKTPNLKESRKSQHPAFDLRSWIRRKSTQELRIFEERWVKAAEEDRGWVDPYKSNNRWFVFQPYTRGKKAKQNK